jgi:hypothetical protein
MEDMRPRARTTEASPDVSRPGPARRRAAWDFLLRGMHWSRRGRSDRAASSTPGWMQSPEEIAAIEGLAAAWTRECGQTSLSPAMLVDGGWTPALVGDVFTLARHAATHRGGLWEAKVPHEIRDAPLGVQADPLAEWLTILAGGGPFRPSLLGTGGWGWLEVAASAPTYADHRRLTALLSALTPENQADWDAWSTVPGVSGPWAWAAGLTATEAHALPETTEEIRRLRGLAALRGWAQPRDVSDPSASVPT